jgi:hypothetical protein
MKNLFQILTEWYCILAGHTWKRLYSEKKVDENGCIFFYRRLVCLRCHKTGEDNIIPSYISTGIKSTGNYC